MKVFFDLKTIDMSVKMTEWLKYWTIIFASTFYTNGTKEESRAQSNSIHLSNCDFSEDTIIKVIDNMEVNKSHWPECIAPQVLTKVFLKSVILCQ